MNGSPRLALAVVLLLAAPVAAQAQNHAGGGTVTGGGGGHASSGGAGHISTGGGHVSAPPAPAAPPTQGQHGFVFPNETNVRPMPPQHPVVQPGSPGTVVNGRPYRQAPYTGTITGGPYHGQFHGPVVRNPHRWWGWGWNHGVPWYPAPIYWGGGFWGPFAFSGFTAGLLFGSIIDSQDQMIYPSYQIGQSSPGAQLLQDYGLQQTECGPPNLVVIWGPDNSVICAYPNDLVAPGNYQLDPATLTIVSRS